MKEKVAEYLGLFKELQSETQALVSRNTQQAEVATAAAAASVLATKTANGVVSA